MTICDIPTEKADADNSEDKSPTARPRANPPAYVYDAHTIVEEEAGKQRHKPTIQMSTPSDAMGVEHLHAEQQTRTRYSLIVDSSSALHNGELISTQRNAPPPTRPKKSTC